MAKLIEELKKEHTAIVEGLERIRESGISSKEGQQWLLNAKQNLLAHLKKEDDQLYPVLNKAAEKDPALKQTLEFFARDMAETSKTAIDFFDKYSKGGSGMAFATDFGRLFASLKSRIHREEDIIYKKYERLNP